MNLVFEIRYLTKVAIYGLATIWASWFLVVGIFGGRLPIPATQLYVDPRADLGWIAFSMGLVYVLALVLVRLVDWFVGFLFDSEYRDNSLRFISALVVLNMAYAASLVAEEVAGVRARVPAFLAAGYFALFAAWRLRYLVRNPQAFEVLGASFRRRARVRHEFEGLTLEDVSRSAVRNARLFELRWLIYTGGCALFLGLALFIADDAWALGCAVFVGALLLVSTLMDVVTERRKGGTHAGRQLGRGQRARLRYYTVVNGFTTLVLGVGLALLTFAVRWFIHGDPDVGAYSLDPPMMMAFLVFGLMFLISARAASRWVRGYVGEPDAETVDEAPELSTTVYLRSFRDDPLPVEGGRGTATFLEALSFGSNVRFEEVIATSLQNAGQVQAIAEPGSASRRLGAVKAYFSDADWQSGAASMISQARAVAMVAGRTGGLEWELTHILRSGSLGKLLVVLPPVSEASLQHRWDTVRRALGLPDLGQLSLGRLRPILAFRSEVRGPVVVVSSVRNERAYTEAILLALREITMYPPRPIPNTEITTSDWRPAAVPPALGASSEESIEELVGEEGWGQIAAVGSDLAGRWGMYNDAWLRPDAKAYLRNEDEARIRRARVDDVRRIAWLIRRGLDDDLPPHWNRASRRAFATDYLSESMVTERLNGGLSLLATSRNGAPFGCVLVRATSLGELGIETSPGEAAQRMVLAVDWMTIHPLVRYSPLGQDLLKDALRDAAESGCDEFVVSVFPDGTRISEPLIELGLEPFGLRTVVAGEQSAKQHLYAKTLAPAPPCDGVTPSTLRDAG